MAKAPAKKDEKQEDLIDKIDETPELEAQEQEENPELEAGEQEEEVPEQQQEDAAALLQKQIDALRKSEEIHKTRAERYRQEADEARQQAAEKAQEANRGKKDTVQAQFDAVSTALAAAQNEAESAKREIKSAIAAQDVDAQADAYERLAAAQANIANLQSGKIELEQRIKNPPPEETPKNSIPPRIQRWLARHPEFMSDSKKNDKLRAFHWDVIDEGHDFDSDEYIESMELKLGLRKPPQEEEEVVPDKLKKPVEVSAPVSREAPSGSGTGVRSGTIKLTAAQREAAKNSGVTEKVYAENLQKLQEMKANGMYTGGQ